jgi:transcription initiation factor IIE alpha subunit
MNIQEILDEAMGSKFECLGSRSISESYNYGKIDETISRMENKLDKICQDLKNLTQTLGEL